MLNLTVSLLDLLSTFICIPPFYFAVNVLDELLRIFLDFEKEKALDSKTIGSIIAAINSILSA